MAQPVIGVWNRPDSIRYRSLSSAKKVRNLIISRRLGRFVTIIQSKRLEDNSVTYTTSVSLRQSILSVPDCAISNRRLIRRTNDISQGMEREGRCISTNTAIDIAISHIVSQ